MKQQIAFILLLFSLFTRAQTDKITEALFKTPNIAIESATLLHGEGVRDAWQVLIFGEDDAFAKSWKKFIKNNYSLEGHREGGMYVCGPVLSAALSADTISVLYKIEKDGDFIRMTLLSKTKQNYSTPTDGTGLMDKTKAMIEKGIHQFYIGEYDDRITLLQRNYDRQIKDAEKAVKQGERLKKDKASHEKSIDKLQGDISNLRSNISKINADKSSLNSKLELDKREADQAKKEIENLETQLREKELEYNEKIATGELSEKKTEKAREDLVKRREKISKLQEKLIGKNSKVTDTENRMLQAERKLSETQSSLEKKEAEITSHRNSIDQLNKEISVNEGDIKEENLQVESAKLELEKLKQAKAGMVLLN
jgi:outer membrane murein-binding lipoprotein Lpp